MIFLSSPNFIPALFASGADSTRMQGLGYSAATHRRANPKPDRDIFPDIFRSHVYSSTSTTIFSLHVCLPACLASIFSTIYCVVYIYIYGCGSNIIVGITKDTNLYGWSNTYSYEFFTFFYHESSCLYLK
jgi:hypothetical protein